MKKTVISAAIVGFSYAGFKNDMDKAGHWYDEHQGAVDGAITTAAQVGKIIAGAQNDNQFGIEQRAEWTAKHAGDIARVAGMFGDENGDDELGIKQRAEWEWKHRKAIAKILRAVGDQNDDELGVKQRAEFVAKHGKTIARIAAMFGDANDDELESIGKKAWHFFENGPELELGFKQDVDKAGDWYSRNQGAVDDAITTAAKLGKKLASDQNDDEFGIEQRADWALKHAGDIKTILGDQNDNELVTAKEAWHFFKYGPELELSFKSVTDKIGEVLGDVGDAAKVGKIIAGDENDNEFGIKQRAEFVAKHGKTIARIASMFGVELDDELSFKSVTDKIGDVLNDVGDAAKVGKIIAGDQNEVNDHLRKDSNLKSLKGHEAPVRRGFLGHN